MLHFFLWSFHVKNKQVVVNLSYKKILFQLFFLALTIKFVKRLRDEDQAFWLHEWLSAIRDNSDKHHNYLAPTKSVMCEIEATFFPFLLLNMVPFHIRQEYVKLIYYSLISNFSKCYLTPYGPGKGANHPPSYKKCHNFWKANGIDLKFYDFS